MRETVNEEYLTTLTAAHLVPRSGNDHDLASAVVYPATDATSFITAQTVVVDGGLSSHTPAMSPMISCEEHN
jgi:NAD(P)-dependent dehydrogenase (short-subunit alcohol dehydrogenase family)